MTAAAGWAAGLAAASVLIGRASGGRLLLARVRPLPPSTSGRRLLSCRRPGLDGGRWWVVVAALGTTAALGAGRPVLSAVPPLLALVIVRERRAVARSRAAAVERRRVREFASLAAAELRAGRPARTALGRAATDVAVAGPVDQGGPPPRPGEGPWPLAVAGAAGSGGDVAEVLAGHAARPGAEALRDIAACWRVAEGTGAGLAAALDVVAAGLRERDAQRREIAAQLAGVRATGYLLAALPAFGLLLGGTLGAQPWRVLVDTDLGNAALAAGLALDVAGLAWLGRLVRRAEAAHDGPAHDEWAPAGRAGRVRTGGAA